MARVGTGAKVLISGASVSGLTTAYWLRRYGFDVTIVEVSGGIRPGGQALDIRGPAIEVSRRMGIFGDLQRLSTNLRGMSFVDADGKEIFESTERTFTGGSLESEDVEILRDDLCAVLYAALEEGVDFIFNTSVASLTDDDHGVDVVLANGEKDHFDLVIGADGLHSGVRRLIFGPERGLLRYLGLNIAVFGMPNFLALDQWQVFHSHGHIFGGALGFDIDTQAKVYIAFPTEELLEYDYRDIDAQKRLVADHVAEVRWEFPKIIEHMMEASDFHFDATCQVVLDQWSRGRIGLVGDAAYSVSPIIGQGTTVSMVGAYVLAGELAAHEHDLSAGLRNYQNELQQYITNNQETSRKSGIGPLISIGEGAPDGSGIPDFGTMVEPFNLKAY